MPKNLPKNQEDAAIVFQAAWRGRKARKSLKKAPKTSSPSDYLTFASSNEPAHKFKQSEKLNGHFVLVGTSGLTNLQLIKEAIALPGIKSDGYKNIPKLFIIDNSAHVKEFWELLKYAFANSKNLKEFEVNICSARGKFRTCCRGYGLPEEIMDNIEKLTQADQLASTDQWYQYFKNIVGKATIICDDWACEEVFTYIKMVTDQKVPIIVYASNILEFVGGDNTAQTTYAVQSMMRNIEALNPVYTIHSRTSCKASASYSTVSVCLKPDCLVVLNNQQIKTEHLKLLTDPALIDLCGKYTHLSGIAQPIDPFEKFFIALNSSFMINNPMGLQIFSTNFSSSSSNFHVNTNNNYETKKLAQPEPNKNFLGLKKGFLNSK